MHMADALISPLVGGVMWGTSAGAIGYSAKKVHIDLSETKIPLMGVMGAFIFAAQMITITLPGTGSSGHIGGGMLLAILLGPYAGFLTMASVLVIQALMFADGGLLALGCNIMNLGFMTCFIAYPLIYKPIMKGKQSSKKLFIATLIASVIGLQLGSLGVVFETFLSGRTEIPLISFLLVMQPIHLIIGIGEGLLTAVILLYIQKERPEMIGELHIEGITKENDKNQNIKLYATIMVLALIFAGIFSLWASSNPDGLEWSIEQVAESELEEPDSAIHNAAKNLQEEVSILPDYELKNTDDQSSSADWKGTTISGIAGSLVTLALVFGLALFLKRHHKKSRLTKEAQNDEH